MLWIWVLSSCTVVAKYRRESGVSVNSCLELGEPMARRGLEGRPDGRERVGAGSNGSELSKEMYAGGPGSNVRYLSLAGASVAGGSSGRALGGSDRRFRGKVHIRHADVRMKMLYVR